MPTDALEAHVAAELAARDEAASVALARKLSGGAEAQAAQQRKDLEKQAKEYDVAQQQWEAEAAQQQREKKQRERKGGRKRGKDRGGNGKRKGRMYWRWSRERRIPR